MSEVESQSDEVDEWMPFKHAVPKFVRNLSIHVNGVLLNAKYSLHRKWNSAFPSPKLCSPPSKSKNAHSFCLYIPHSSSRPAHMPQELGSPLVLMDYVDRVSSCREFVPRPRGILPGSSLHFSKCLRHSWILSGMADSVALGFAFLLCASIYEASSINHLPCTWLQSGINTHEI